MRGDYTLSWEQYKELERGEKTLKQLKRERREMQKLETLATEIMENPKLRRMFVVAVAGINYTSKVLADTTIMVAKIDNAGFRFLGLGQTLGYWFCLIGCILEILKSVMNGGNREVGKILMKYILYFASLYLVPFAFDLIIEFFG